MLSVSSPIIEIDQLTFGYSDSPIVLSIEQWLIDEGQSVFIHGDSGSGKSTLLKLIAGILTPQTGSISVDNQQLATLTESQRDRFRARNVGWVFQSFNLIPYLSVTKNIEIANFFSGTQIDELQQRILSMFEQLKLPSNLLNRPAGELSSGQQQRVAIIRALINQPKVLLVDEPTSALDNTSTIAFMNMLFELTKPLRTTLVFVSHDLSLSSYFDEVVDLQCLNRVQG